MPIRPEDFQFLSTFLKQRSGLALTADKEYLLESRLQPIARARSLNDISGIVFELKKPTSSALATEVVEAMTTNESLFFRDGKPFDYMKQALLPMLRRQAESKKKLRIWSAASSTGQEPYSIALTILEEPASPPGWNYEIIATDLAQKVIDRAKEGVYSQFEVQRGMPIQLLVKYFTQTGDTGWQLKENVRSMVKFQIQNLLEDFGRLGKFDLVFCRNVLIYFDEPAKNDIVRRIVNIMEPGGVLIIGGTESIMDKTINVLPLDSMRGVYQVKK